MTIQNYCLIISPDRGMILERPRFILLFRQAGAAYQQETQIRFRLWSVWQKGWWIIDDTCQRMDISSLASTFFFGAKPPLQITLSFCHAVRHFDMIVSPLIDSVIALYFMDKDIFVSCKNHFIVLNKFLLKPNYDNLWLQIYYIALKKPFFCVNNSLF